MDKCTEIRTCFCGAEGSGKTSIIRQLVYDTFWQAYEPTTAAETFVYSVRVLGDSYKFVLLDTPGSERSVEKRTSWFRECAAFVLVFSIHDRATFLEVELFLQQILLAYQGNKALSILPIILLGNQIDREEDRQVTVVEAHAFAKKHDLQYFECSARLKITLSDFIEQIPVVVNRKHHAEQMTATDSIIDFWKLAQNARALFRGKSPTENPAKSQAVEILQGAANPSDLQGAVGGTFTHENNALAIAQLALHGTPGDGVTRLDLANRALNPAMLSKVLWHTFTALQYLNLENNGLLTLPLEIAFNCPALVDVQFVQGNKLTKIPPPYRSGPWEKTKSYLLTQGPKPLNTFWRERKLVIVGQEGVGKTTLLKCFAQKSNRVSCKENISTHGVNIQRGVSLSTAKDISFNSWDFGGQQVFYPTHQFFLTGNSIFIVAFHLAEIGSSRLEYWMNQIRATGAQNGINPPILMVGTHLDAKCCTPEFVDEKLAELSSHYPKRRFNGLDGIYTVSCKKGTGVKELKQRLVDLAGFMPIITPVTWMRLKDRIMSLDTQYITWAAWRDMALDFGLSEAELRPAITLFSDTGILLYYDDQQSGLSDLVILDTSWLADVMADLIGFRSTWVKDGILEHRNVPHIFKRYPPRLHDQILALLLKFSVLHPMKSPVTLLDSSSSPALTTPPALAPSPLSTAAVTTTTSNASCDSSPGLSTSNPGSPTSSPPPVPSRTRVNKSGSSIVVSGTTITRPSSGSNAAIQNRSSSPHCSVTSTATTTTTTTTTVINAAGVATTTTSSTSTSSPAGGAASTPIRRSVEPVPVRPSSPISSKEPPATYLVPSLLSPDRPEEILAQHWWSVPERSERGRVFKFGFMPLGFFERIMVRVLHIPAIEMLAMWSTGLLARFRGENTLLTYDPKIYHLSIRVRSISGDPLQLLTELVSVTESLLECYYPKLKDSTSRWLNCTHCTTHGVQTPYQFRFEECVAAITSDNPFVYCHGIRSRSVRVDQLAPDIAFVSFPNIDATQLQIQRLLGEGGSGQVYLALFASSRVAVKRLPSDPRASSDPIKRANKFLEFQREATMMRSLRHPNIVNFLGITLQPLQLVIEFIPNGDLHQLLRPDAQVATTQINSIVRVLDEERLPWKLRYRIAFDVARAMRYLQSITPPVIHRDLRSPNIFIVSTDPEAPVCAKVADFGLAAYVAPDVAGLLGTWQWLAPEVIDSQSTIYDERSDVYSFGMVCWELVTGDAPFDEFYPNPDYVNQYGKLNEHRLKNEIIHHHLRPTIPDQCPEAFAVLIRDCWTGNAASRPSFHSIVKWLADLGDFGDTLESSSSVRLVKSLSKLGAPPTPPAERPHRRISAETEVASRLIPLPKTAYCFVKAYDRIWVGCSDGTLVIFPAEPDFSHEVQPLHRFKYHTDRIYSMVYVQSSDSIWTGSSDGTIQVWDAKTIEMRKEWLAHDAQSCMVRSLLVVSNTRVWSASPAEEAIRIWDLRTYQLISRVTVGPVTCMALVNNRVWLGIENRLAVCSSQTGEKLGEWDVPLNNLVNHMETIPLSREIWVCSKSILVWQASADSVELVDQLEAHGNRITCATTLGSQVWTGAYDNSVIAWDATSRKPLFEYLLAEKQGLRSIISANRTIWCGLLDGNILVLEPGRARTRAATHWASPSSAPSASASNNSSGSSSNKPLPLADKERKISLASTRKRLFSGLFHSHAPVEQADPAVPLTRSGRRSSSFSALELDCDSLSLSDDSDHEGIEEADDDDPTTPVRPTTAGASAPALGDSSGHGESRAEKRNSRNRSRSFF